jgi:hypothetical protein
MTLPTTIPNLTWIQSFIDLGNTMSAFASGYIDLSTVFEDSWDWKSIDGNYATPTTETRLNFQAVYTGNNHQILAVAFLS